MILLFALACGEPEPEPEPAAVVPAPAAVVPAPAAPEPAREPTPEEILPARKPPPGTGDVTVFYDTPEELQRVHVKCDDGFDDWPVPRKNRVIVRGLPLGATCEITPLTKYTRHSVRPGDDLVCRIPRVDKVEDLSIVCEPRG
jgi:hypothetical protein